MALPSATRRVRGRERKLSHKKEALWWRNQTRGLLGTFKSERGEFDWGRERKPEPKREHAIAAHARRSKWNSKIVGTVTYPNRVEKFATGRARKKRSKGK